MHRGAGPLPKSGPGDAMYRGEWSSFQQGSKPEGPRPDTGSVYESPSAGQKMWLETEHQRRAIQTEFDFGTHIQCGIAVKT